MVPLILEESRGVPLAASWPMMLHGPLAAAIAAAAAAATPAPLHA